MKKYWCKCSCYHCTGLIEDWWWIGLIDSIASFSGLTGRAGWRNCVLTGRAGTDSLTRIKINHREAAISRWFIFVLITTYSLSALCLLTPTPESPLTPVSQYGEIKGGDDGVVRAGGESVRLLIMQGLILELRKRISLLSAALAVWGWWLHAVGMGQWDHWCMAVLEFIAITYVTGVRHLYWTLHYCTEKNWTGLDKFFGTVYWLSTYIMELWHFLVEIFVNKQRYHKESKQSEDAVYCLWPE